MRGILKYLLPAFMLGVAVVVCYKLWTFYITGSWTRDGRISADVVQVSAEVPGVLVRLPISDNMFVTKGRLLAQIDDKDYAIRLRDVEAKLKEAQLRRDNASAQYARRNRATTAVSREELDNSRLQLDALDANIAQLRVALEQAQLNLSRTKIYAPADGFITNLRLREGNYIPAGQPLFALVDSASFYVVAYFEETKMPHVRPGKKVSIAPYAGGPDLSGVITGYGRAIADQSSSTGEQLVRNVQPTYPWIRLAQRVPVRIAINDMDENKLGKKLIAGTTCTVKILD